MSTNPGIRWNGPCRAALIAGGITLLAGCVGTKSTRLASLRADQFADPGAPETAADPSPPVRAVTERPPAERRTLAEATDGVIDVVARPGEPELADEPAAPKGASVLVDGTAGYVNNRAIYINDFLAPMADRMRADAKVLPRNVWLNGKWEGDTQVVVGARQKIRQALELLVRDELLRAEAMATVAGSEEKRRGLLAYFDQKRGDILRRFGGTESAANEQLAQREDQSLPDFGSDVQGKSVDELLDAIKNRELINYQIQTRVGSRAYVPWRDVLNAYENQYDTFNPPPTVVLRLIRVKGSNTAGIDEVRAALAAGADFAEVASRPCNEYKREQGGELRRELDGPLETTKLLEIQPLDAAAHALAVGGVAGPIEYRKDMYWIKLDEVRESPRTMGLYEAQLSLEYRLRKSKFEEELTRHLNRLKERASFTGIDEMTERLTAVAIERFYPEAPAPGAAGAPTPAAPAPGRQP